MVLTGRAAPALGVSGRKWINLARNLPILQIP